MPKSSASKLAKTAPEKIGALGASTELGDEPTLMKDPVKEMSAVGSLLSLAPCGRYL